MMTFIQSSFFSMKYVGIGILSILAYPLSFGVCPARAQTADFLTRIEIPSSPNPVGSGARALGMGGAFIGVADDATAASWNPGGLMQLELPEASMVLEGVHRIEELHFGAHPEADGEESISYTDLNYFSVAYPFALAGYNMIVSLNYQKLFDFHREWWFPIQEPDLSQNAAYQLEGDLAALGLAYAVQVTPTISAGLTFNIWDDGLLDNEWEDRRWQWGTGTDAGDRFAFALSSLDRYSFSGYNVNLGVLWNATGKLNLGAVFKSPFEADISHSHSTQTQIQFPDFPIFDTETRNQFKEDAVLEMPMSFGMGAAYRFTKSLTLSMDLYWTDWSEFEFEDGQGNKTSPITGAPSGESDVDDTVQVRMGGEYLWILPQVVIPFRAGLFYDPAPAPGHPDDFFGISLGSGVGYKRYVFDIAYQFRWGDDVGDAILKEWRFSQDVREHTVYGSLIVHF